MPPTTGYSFGDVVLVPFPFTDQAGIKKRPAVIISSAAYNTVQRDLVVMAVTSQLRPSGALGEARVADWQAAGLIKPSAIKPVITNASGAVIERFAYEAFGKRRFPNGTADPNNTIFGVTTDRGFTTHEHLDEIALIHMNGRVYDPLIARFMTADLNIQSPSDLQSYNRYTYVLNNPLMYTDPSGYFSFKKFFRIAAAVAVAVFAPEAIAAISNGAIAANSFAAAAISGGLSGAVATGNLQGTLQGAFTAGLFNFAAGVTSPGVERIAAHAAVGCITSSVGNGSCGSGALAAGVAKFATGALNGIEHLNDLGRGIAVSIIGGTASVIGGGKFENGAATAAFGYLFNYCAHNGCFDRDFTLADAKANYQSGNGAPITDVGANEINLAGAGYLAKNAPNEFQVNLSPATGSYYIYGTVTGVLDSNGNMSFRSDTYNFDYKDPALGQNTIESGRIVARNAGTFAGRVYNGSGTPYQINFSGSQALPPDTVNRLRNCAPGRAC